MGTVSISANIFCRQKIRFVWRSSKLNVLNNPLIKSNTQFCDKVVGKNYKLEFIEPSEGDRDHRAKKTNLALLYTH